MLLGGGELDGRRIIGRKTLELMTGNHLPEDGTCASTPPADSARPSSKGSASGSASPSARARCATAMAGSPGEYYWGGAASTAFWIDPVEDLAVVFMTQLFPSVSYPFRAQLRALVYQALAD